MLRALGVLLLSASSLSAQRTWIVDRDNRPGADFPDLPPAIAAASPGDVVFLRSASGPAYSGTSLSVGITLRGEVVGGLVPAIDSLTVSSVPATQRVTLVDLYANTLALRSCPGVISCENTSTGLGMPFEVRNCAHVVLRRGSAGGTSATVVSSFLFCESFGAGSWLWAPGNYYLGAYLAATDSWIASTASSWVGRNGNTGYWCKSGGAPAQSAIGLTNSTLIASRGSSFGGGYLGPGPGCANPGGCYGSVFGTGVLVLDPSCSVGCGTIVRETRTCLIPRLTTTTVTHSAAATVRCDAPRDSFALIAVSRGIGPSTPTGVGDLWIDPNAFHILAVTAINETVEVPLPAPVFVPAYDILTVQAAVMAPDGTVGLTLPSFPVVIP